MKIVRTTSENPDFIRLTKLLDEFLADYNGEADPFYSEFNKIQLPHTIIHQDTLLNALL